MKRKAIFETRLFLVWRSIGLFVRLFVRSTLTRTHHLCRSIDVNIRKSPSPSPTSITPSPLPSLVTTPVSLHRSHPTISRSWWWASCWRPLSAHFLFFLLLSHYPPKDKRRLGSDDMDRFLLTSLDGGQDSRKKMKQLLLKVLEGLYELI